jgi:hypothetical protein
LFDIDWLTRNDRTCVGGGGGACINQAVVDPPSSEISIFLLDNLYLHVQKLVDMIVDNLYIPVEVHKKCTGNSNTTAVVLLLLFHID